MSDNGEKWLRRIIVFYIVAVTLLAALGISLKGGN